MLHAQIAWHASMGKVCQYMSYKQTHCRQPCDKEWYTEMTMMPTPMIMFWPNHPETRAGILLGKDAFQHLGCWQNYANKIVYVKRLITLRSETKKL